MREWWPVPQGEAENGSDLAGKQRGGKEQRKVKAREEQVTGKKLKGLLEDGWALWVCAEVGPGGSGITRVPFFTHYFPLQFYFMSCFS